jgi:hypothetical protein
MQKPSTLIGQCSQGHDVYVTRGIDGEIDGGLIGTQAVAALPDGESRHSIIVACEACVALVNK